MSTIEMIKKKYESLSAHMDEKVKRLWVAAEAMTIGRGGIAKVVKATGISPKTIKVGMVEIGQKPEQTAEKKLGGVRRKGGGRKALKEKDITLITTLEELLDPVTRGDPESPLRWSSKSTAKLAEELQAKGYGISPRTVASLLHQLDFAYRVIRKQKKGRITLIEMRNLCISMSRYKLFKIVGSRLFRLTRRRRNLLGNTKMMEENGGPRVNRLK